MKELNNDPQFEIKQVCPKVSPLEFLRASLLFGLLFGMIVLASMPQGTIPVLFLFAPDESENTASSAPRNVSIPTREENNHSPEKRFALPFGNENRVAIGQTVQATSATPPQPEGNQLTPLENSRPVSDFIATPFEECTTASAPSDQPQTGCEETSRFAAMGTYPPPLEGMSPTGFSGRGYQISRGAVPNEMSIPPVDDYQAAPIGQEQYPFKVGSGPNPPISWENANPKVHDLARQLQQLGAVRFRLETWGSHDSSYRFWCEMPLSSVDGTVAFFEAVASQPEKAMENVVRQVESWLRETIRPNQ